jgi:mannan endo-1,4-beta-mannosidase
VSSHRASRSKLRLRAWTFVTVPALVFCCLYASGMLGAVAPRGWHPPEATPAQQAEHARVAALAARARLAKDGRAKYQAHLKTLGTLPGSNRFFGAGIPGNMLRKWFCGPQGGKSSDGTGVHPQLLMSFQSWGARKRKDRMPTRELSEDQPVGIRAEMFTWQPWQPPSRGVSIEQQERAQHKFSNQAIADGKWDHYIIQWADAVRRFPDIRVYIRFGHEMNGTWYPWSLDPHEYVLAWQHIWNIFQQQRVTNARFVWSADFGEGPPDAPGWETNLMAYWPGSKYVNDIGTTMINFGGSDSHTVDQFTQRINYVHNLLKMPVMLTEVNTDQQGRRRWMLDLARYVGQTSWVNGVVWSQQPSYGAGNMVTGNMKWQVWHDPGSRARQAFIKLADAASGTRLHGHSPACSDA